MCSSDLSGGSSYFESLNLRIEKRLSHGLNLVGNYMYSKLMEEDTYLNDTDPRPEKRISPFDHPHHFVLGFSYELPVGKDRSVKLRSRWTNLVLGGWLVNGIYTYQTGAPIFWSTDPVYFGGPLNVNPRQVNGPAFDVTRFDRNASDQFEYHVRTFSSTFGNLRMDGINNLDASLLKNFYMTEVRYFQLRFEAFNSLNHPSFGALGTPITTPTATNFGDLTTQANLPRQIQLGARFVF